MLRVMNNSDFSYVSIYFADRVKLNIFLNGMTWESMRKCIYKEYLISSVGSESHCDLQILCCNKILPIVDILG